MSGAASYATSLNRRSSIHSAARPNSNPPRQYSTFKIEVEYISTSQQSVIALSSQRTGIQNLETITELNLNRDNDDRALRSVLEEDEGEGEDSEAGIQKQTQAQTQGHMQIRGVQAPPIPSSSRPYPTSISRQRPLRTQSEQYHTRAGQYPQLEDQSARLYRPNSQATPRGAVAPLRHNTAVVAHTVGRSAGYHLQTTISRSDYLQSSHVQHDETPVLSSAGSQSDEDEDDEVHSPVEHLVVDDENGDEDKAPSSNDNHGSHAQDSTDQGKSSQDSLPLSQEIQETPELETQETLKRERTRILERTVVSSYRQIDFKDISNIQPLKRGGYGEIHTAEWSHLRVVLKRALPEHSEGMEQFDQELEILKRVHDYDFIVPFYGVTTDPHTNVRCMVMKHCTNGNLCSFLEKHHDNLTWSERYRLSIEITKGLEFLHKSGFHHRDLHSGNILLDDKRTAMICDFGLSRSSNKEQTTDVAATVGVASFLAPERFPQQRPVYSAACDIYSLGVIFWHISSGRIPFVKRLREPVLLRELMEGHREEIVPGTPKEFRDLIVKCWDVKAANRLKIDVIIAILQTLMAKPSEPIHQVSTGFIVPSDTTSAALPVPPELDARMASLERASNTLNRMVFDIQDPMMREIVDYIERTRAYFRDQRIPLEPYSPSNPPKTPIYLCPLVGDIAALQYHLSHNGSYYNPINESSVRTGDTALHLACLFLESPMDTIKILVELGADINLENLQGYTPVMILVSSNTQYCYEALKFFVMRGARIPAYIRSPITPLNSAQMYALNLVNESRQIYPDGYLKTGEGAGVGPGAMPPFLSQDRRHSRQRVSSPNLNVHQERNGRKVERIYAQGRPLIHVVAAMQEDYRILDCLCEAGLDPAMHFAGETALVAAAAHLRIKNVEWLLNHDLDISTEAGVQRAIKVVKLLHHYPSSGTNPYYGMGGHSKSSSSSSTSGSRMTDNSQISQEFPDDIRDLGKYSWAGVAYGDADRMSKDMVGPVLNLLERWTGSRRIANRKEVATKLKLMYGSSMDVRVSSISATSTNSDSSASSQGSHRVSQPSRQNLARGGLVQGTKSLRKSQRHVVDQVLNEKPPMRFW
ncbi:hypothetical protein BGZ54_001523 [Gamsiella multidivaricata]|nr:hypothetical protein BGZ54_001523 [Gamsiella multidivaricata]